MTKSDIMKHHRQTALQFFKFGIVGVVGFSVDSAMLYFGIYALGLGRVTAGFFSFPFAVTVNWIGHRIFTFRDAPPMQAAQQKKPRVLTGRAVLHPRLFGPAQHAAHGVQQPAFA